MPEMAVLLPFRNIYKPLPIFLEYIEQTFKHAESV